MRRHHPSSCVSCLPVACAEEPIYNTSDLPLRRVTSLTRRLTSASSIVPRFLLQDLPLHSTNRPSRARPYRCRGTYFMAVCCAAWRRSQSTAPLWRLDVPFHLSNATSPSCVAGKTWFTAWLWRFASATCCTYHKRRQARIFTLAFHRMFECSPSCIGRKTWFYIMISAPCLSYVLRLPKMRPQRRAAWHRVYLASALHCFTWSPAHVCPLVLYLLLSPSVNDRYPGIQQRPTQQQHYRN